MCDERWEQLIWDRAPHLIKYTRSNIECLNRHVRLAFGLQKLHKEYGKGISRLIRNQKSKGSEGESVGNCWKSLMSELGSVAARHKSLSVILGDVATQYQSEAELFSEEQRNLEISSKKIQAELETHVINLDKVKERFHRKQHEAHKAEEALNRCDAGPAIDNKDVDKLRDAFEEKRDKSEKAKEDYRNQLIETNRKQREYYSEKLPAVFSGMRTVAERTEECVASLVNRLSISGCEEWENLGEISEAIQPEEDFEVFISWAKSGNLPPSDFTFQEEIIPGSTHFSPMGTLRKSLSRSSLRFNSSGNGRFNSRLSLRNFGQLEPQSPRLPFSSVKEEDNCSQTPKNLSSVKDVSEDFNNTTTSIEEESANDEGINDKEENGDALKQEIKSRHSTGSDTVDSLGSLRNARPVPATRHSILKRQSYDDSMNPFMKESDDSEGI